MPNKNNLLLLIVLLFILVGGYLALSFYTKENYNEQEELSEELDESEEMVEASSLSGFSWRFVEADTNNPDGNPQTKVFLRASYENGYGVEKLVDTVDGGCSELEGESYEGDISNTGKVQCYYAGLGQQYRIIESEDTYVVERKFSEEAQPDYNPPEAPWEVIADFKKEN